MPSRASAGPPVVTGKGRRAAGDYEHRRHRGDPYSRCAAHLIKLSAAGSKRLWRLPEMRLLHGWGVLGSVPTSRGRSRQLGRGVDPVLGPRGTGHQHPVMVREAGKDGDTFG